MIDTRGLRFYLADKKIKNSIYIHSRWKNFGNVRFGLSHTLHQLNLDFGKEKINNLFASFRSDVKFGKSFILNLDAHLGLLDYAGDFHLKGNISFTSKFGNFKLGTNIKRNKPNFLSSRLYINEQQIYNYNYTRPVSLDFFIKWAFGKTELTASQLTINKPIYFDENVLPTQFGGTYTNSRFSISQKIKLGIFHLDNYLFYQIYSQNLFSLPAYFTKHDIYLKSHLFKKRMLFKFGVDLRLISEFAVPAYFPLTGQFYIQNEERLDFYPEADFYFIFKVDTFRAFFRLNNVSGYFYPGVRFQVATYPQFDNNFRFGISWIMKD